MPPVAVLLFQFLNVTLPMFQWKVTIGLSLFCCGLQFVCQLCKFLRSLVDKSYEQCWLGDEDPSWCLDDQSFEKMGAVMAENHAKALGLYDELPMFLSQFNVCRSKGLP